MGVTLKIRFIGRKKDLRPFWVPVVFELKPAGSKKPLLFSIKNFDRQVKDDKDRRMSFFSIPNLPPGRYTLSILEFHTGHPIISGKRLELKGKEVEFGLVKNYRMPKQPNTFGMDLVADAPYRIEGSCRYLPVVVFIQDVEPGEIKISSIELYHYPSAEEFQNQKLPEDVVYRVLDADGNPVEKDGRPALLDYDPGERYETVNSDPWYRIILLRKDRLPVYEGDYWGYKKARYLQYLVNVRYRRFISDSKQFVLRTRVPDGDLPKFADWHYGDTHYHSEYTRNPYEYGGPLSMTAEVAKANGLSWVTVTDHSYCLGHPKTLQEEAQGNRWQSYQRGVKKVNDRYKDVLLVGAEEITVRRGFFGLHLLSFGNPFVEDDHPAGFGSLKMKEVLDRVLEGSGTTQGFLYAAHPACSGYVWEEEDYRVASDPRYSGIFLGLQLFNEKILYQQTTQSSMDVDFLNPFAMLDESGRKSNWSKELDEGQSTGESFCSLLRISAGGNSEVFHPGRPTLTWISTTLLPPRSFIHYLNDNAFGKVRTLVHFPKTNGRVVTEKPVPRLPGWECPGDRWASWPFSLRPKNSGNLPAGGNRSASIGEDLNCPEWKSTPSSVRSRKSTLPRHNQGETEVTNQIRFPRRRKKSYEFEGSIQQVFFNWEAIPCYLRLEAASGIDPESGEALFRCLTNPIWIVAG
jgi:hypothetical protein